MQLRNLTAADAPAVKRLHARMNLGYDLPDPRTALFVRTGMFEGSRLVSAVLGRKTSEAYLLVDSSWASPQERWEAIGRLVVTGAQQAKIEGIEDVHVWLPPAIEKRFSRRLAAFGFVKAPWNCYTARL